MTILLRENYLPDALGWIMFHRRVDLEEFSTDASPHESPVTLLQCRARITVLTGELFESRTAPMDNIATAANDLSSILPKKRVTSAALHQR